MGKVFISYRRDDAPDTVGRIDDWLTKHLPHDSIFFDIDSIHGGEDFRVKIEQAVAQSVVMLVIIGPKWAAITEAGGTQRLDNPNDFVRIEIETALRRHIRIIPVLVQGANMPNASHLPPSLAPLAYRNALQVRAGTDFRADMKRVLKTIDSSLHPESEPLIPSPPYPKLSPTPTLATLRVWLWAYIIVTPTALLFTLLSIWQGGGTPDPTVLTVYAVFFGVFLGLVPIVIVVILAARSHQYIWLFNTILISGVLVVASIVLLGLSFTNFVSLIPLNLASIATAMVSMITMPIAYLAWGFGHAGKSAVTPLIYLYPSLIFSVVNIFAGGYFAYLGDGDTQSIPAILALVLTLVLALVLTLRERRYIWFLAILFGPLIVFLIVQFAFGDSGILNFSSWDFSSFWILLAPPFYFIIRIAQEHKHQGRK